MVGNLLISKVWECVVCKSIVMIVFNNQLDIGLFSGHNSMHKTPTTPLVDMQKVMKIV